MSEAAVFTPAKPSDAQVIAQLRLAAWKTTYRGIYPDDVIDQYDVHERAKRDLEKINDPALLVYLIRCGGQPAGYLMFRMEDLFIASLYLLEAYQRRGIGRQAFALVRERCQERGIRQFRCNCNAHNLPAQSFYRAMGGVIVARDEGHANRQENQLTFQFQAG